METFFSQVLGFTIGMFIGGWLWDNGYIERFFRKFIHYYNPYEDYYKKHYTKWWRKKK